MVTDNEYIVRARDVQMGEYMIRIKDIAQQAGVSSTTVSNVIHGNIKRVSPENVDKIRKLLKENNYVPSMAARLLAQDSSNIIGVIVAFQKRGEKNILEDPFIGEMLGALEENIRNQGYFMMLYAAEEPIEIFKLASTWKTDGLIIFGFSESDCINLRKQTKIPFVTIDSYLGGGMQDKASNVGLDDFDGGYQMGKYLVECGHKKLAFLADNDVGVDHYRWLGFRKALEENDIDCEDDLHIIVRKEKSDRRIQYKKMLSWLCERTALFFASDVYAAEAVNFFMDQGIDVPGRISVAGFDDNIFAETVRPRLTTMRQEPALKAGAAVADLMAFIETGDVLNRDTKLPVQLIVRDSVRRL